MNIPIVASAIIHAAVILPLAAMPVADSFMPKKDMTVDYVILKEIVKKSELAKDVEIRIPEAPKVELKPKVDRAPEANGDRNATQSRVSLADEAARRQASAADAAQVKAEERARSTKDYINYYQLIREKIRQRIRRRYGDRTIEGEARINFVMRSDGSLERWGADAAADEGLAAIALASLREAAPFPRFPKELNLPRMSFTVVVVFKRDK
jgi:outer membrane biosynthesis protein TonB